MTRNTTDQLRDRVTHAMVAHAFFRLESALAVCMVILLAFFLPQPLPWWRWWFWLILGLIGEVFIVITSITDERTAQRVVSAVLREQYDPGEIKTPTYRQKVEQALAYREQIERLLGRWPAGVLRDHVQDSLAGIADWVGVIFDIAQRLDAYERDRLLQRDRQEVPQEVIDLQKALAREKEPSVATQIQAALAAKQAQGENLKALQTRMEQARFRLQETLTSLGTVYSQFQLIQAQKLDRTGARDLSRTINEQVQGLHDILSSMNEVYKQS